MEKAIIEATVLCLARSAKSAVGTTILSQCARVVMINMSQADQSQRKVKATKGKKFTR